MHALPSSPDLSFEKKQAKQLLKSVRAGDPSALARVAVHIRRAIDALTLADAQLVIARERGCATWPELKARIEAAQPREAQIEKFLTAVREQQLAVAQRVLKAHPDLPEWSMQVAAAAGDVARVRRWLADHPDPTESQKKDRLLALAYACGSTFHRTSARAAADHLTTVNLLLEAGLDPNLPIAWVDHGTHLTLPLLYFATESGHLPVVRRLLERGARPDDGESTYHSAQHNRVEVLELLLAHGANLSARQEPYGNTPLYFLAGHTSDDRGQAAWAKGMAWLLAHGADPNVGSYVHDEVPLHKAAATASLLDTMRVLLAHGADPNRARADGLTPYAVAIRSGNAAGVSLLRAHGGDDARVAPIDRLLGACFRGDTAAALVIAGTIPGWRDALGPDTRDAIVAAVWRDQPAAIETFVALGFDPSAKGIHGHTPLHPAAWFGRVHLVARLLSLGVDVNVRDDEHGSSPLGWAAHGSRFCRHADADYLKVISLLLDAGATSDAATNRLGERPSSLASKSVAAFLKPRGL